MFKNLLGFWKGKDFLSHVFGDFGEMLDDTEQMFKLVCGSLLEHAEEPDLKKKIYDIDKKVNLLQKENDKWWRTRRWWIQSLRWLVIVNGSLAVGLWIVPGVEPDLKLDSGLAFEFFV